MAVFLWHPLKMELAGLSIQMNIAQMTGTNSSFFGLLVDIPDRARQILPQKLGIFTHFFQP